MIAPFQYTNVDVSKVITVLVCLSPGRKGVVVEVTYRLLPPAE